MPWVGREEGGETFHLFPLDWARDFKGQNFSKKMGRREGGRRIPKRGRERRWGEVGATLRSEVEGRETLRL